MVPRIVIAGAQSGAGKTSITLGMVAAFKRQGLRVQTFKVGPDYLDPTYLALASGRPCYNLDGWMSGEKYVRDLFSRTCADADLAVIEGVMGLFDGADPEGISGSTAEIAIWLQAPIALVVNAHGAARSFAATVHGFATFLPEVRVDGVIANRCGSDRHAEGLRASLAAAALPQMLGAVRRDGLPELPSRHLGLVTADVKQFSCEIIDQLADAVGSAVSLEQVLQVARGAVRIAESRGHGRIACVRRGDSHESPCIQTGEMPVPPDISRAENETSPPTAADAKARLGVAQDEAFHFYYPDNLEALERSGCALIPFSPMHDGALPENLNGIYIGGGYPEEHAQRLAANQSMLESIRQFADSNRVIYAECGGLMYLSQGIETLEGARHQMLGLVPAWTKMCPRRKSLGYVEVTLTRDCLWGRAGDVLRGHEFHYSEIVPLSGLEMPVLSELPVHSSACELAYELRYRRSDYPVTEGFHRGNILGSYAHLHFASRPDAVQHFMSRLQLS